MQLSSGSIRGSVIGPDRDPERIADILGSGTSVIVAGSLGSGKSHLLRSVVAELDDRGSSPLVMRPTRSLGGVAVGTVDATAETLADVISHDGPGLPGGLILVVDDAENLGSELSTALMSAIALRRAVVLVAFEMPRAHAGRRAEPSDAASAFIDMWLRGLAERVDLSELTPDDASRLLDLFPEAERFDAVTRATVINLADGSRILLRELTAHADGALTTGRDPLEAIRDVRRQSRLDDALSAHVRKIGQNERLVLAQLGRLRGISYTDATRIVPASTVGSLLAARLVYDDGTVKRRLYANASLAAECAHQLARGELSAALERATARMLAAPESWWSSAVARVLADRWHGEPDARPPLSHTPAHIRLRVAHDAARLANDEGNSALAVAYAGLADSSSVSADLELERTYAESAMAHSADTAMIPLPPDSDSATVRRYLSLQTSPVARADRTFIENLTLHANVDDTRTRAHIAVASAEDALFRMQWLEAERIALDVIDRPKAGGGIRLRTTLIVAMSRVYRGQWDATILALDRARRLTLTPGAHATLGVHERMLSLGVEIIAAQMVGIETDDIRARLHNETLVASREESLRAMALAGIASALLEVRAGNVDAAVLELTMARRRSVNLAISPAVPMSELSVARHLAVLGRVDTARALLARALEISNDPPALQQHGQNLTESCILAAEGRIDDAISYATAAYELSTNTHSELLVLRDGYQLAALGAADASVLERMRHAAAKTDIALAHTVTDRVAEMIRGRRTPSRRAPIELLRLAVPWTGQPSDLTRFQRRVSPNGTSTDRSPLVAGSVHSIAIQANALTRREHEIGELVAVGLSNRAIAEKLYLSVRTVESHVYQARAKLGARSRSELGRMVSRPGDGGGGVALSR